MNSNTSWIVGFVIVIVVLAGAWYFWGGAAPASPNTQATGSSVPAPNTDTSASAPVAVSYTDSGFSPASVTVRKGQRVTFTNNSSKDMWVATGPHPAHSGYDNTDRSTHCAAGYAGAAPFDECTAAQAGGTFTFTFEKTGTWNYHNHAVAADRGSVVVTE